jgi:putative restriction endonuclease
MASPRDILNGMPRSRPNHEERAARAWPALVDAASKRQTITYGALARALALHQRAIGWLLGPIQDYCIEQRLPPLTVLVVHAADGRPGGGFIGGEPERFQEQVNEVFDFAWRRIPNPFLYALDGSSLEHLGDLLFERGRAAAADVYSRVRTRGILQQVFRHALLHAYGGACAFCGFTFTDALDAAHIAPWDACAPEERVDVRNGLLLCATHHRLFDNDWLRLGADMRVRHVEAEGEYSHTDRVLTMDLDGRALRAPVRPDLTPLDSYVRRRYGE